MHHEPKVSSNFVTGRQGIQFALSRTLSHLLLFARLPADKVSHGPVGQEYGYPREGPKRLQRRGAAETLFFLSWVLTSFWRTETLPSALFGLPHSEFFSDTDATLGGLGDF